MPAKPYELTIPYPLTAQVAGADYTFDLPNEPFSYLDFCIEGINTTADAEELSIEDILSQIDAVSIRLNGADIVTLSGEEIAIYALATQGFVPILTFEDDDASQAFNLIVRLPFSRIAYDRNECYPATPSGNSQARVQIIAAFDKVTSMNLEVVACRLPLATPKHCMTVDVLRQTIAAIGTEDVQLTVQFPYVGLLMYSAAIPNSTVLTATIRYLSLFEDSDQTRLHDIPWQKLRGNLVEKMRNYGWLREHIHKLIEAAYAIGDNTSPQLSEDDSLWDHYGFVDFDPNLDKMDLLNVPRDHNLLARIVSDIAGDVHLFPVILRDVEDMVRR